MNKEDTYWVARSSDDGLFLRITPYMWGPQFIFDCEICDAIKFKEKDRLLSFIEKNKIDRCHPVRVSETTIYSVWSDT
jgi:hypothetical protein